MIPASAPLLSYSAKFIPLKVGRACPVLILFSKKTKHWFFLVFVFFLFGSRKTCQQLYFHETQPRPQTPYAEFNAANMMIKNF